MEKKSIKGLLNKLMAEERLTREEAKSTLLSIAHDKVDPFQVSSFLTCFQMRNITAEELTGFRDAMIEVSLHVDLSEFDTIDIVGTGGDGKNTFNISTASALVVAACGYKVAKHGNVGVSSVCGSSNVLSRLGYKFSNDADKLRRDIDAANFCFLHAPLFHPAMKVVGPIRKALQIKTFFNIMGPLLNPSLNKRQLSGVYSEPLLDLYQSVFEAMDIEYAVVYSVDGYDEISLTDKFLLRTKYSKGRLSSSDLNLPTLSRESLHGGDTVEEAANIFTAILQGKGTTAQKTVVSANAGYAIQRFDPTRDILDCIAEARALLDSDAAMKNFQRIIE